MKLGMAGIDNVCVIMGCYFEGIAVGLLKQQKKNGL